MPELRKDPIVDRWVSIAEQRAARPHDQSSASGSVRRSTNCPFCEGHEQETPSELLAFRPAETGPNEPGWRVRVVPNRYPAFVQTPLAVNRCDDGLFQERPGLGAHEVVIESPEHLGLLSQLPPVHVREMVRSYRDRLRAHRRDGQLVFGMFFKNVGIEAGASLEHVHSQLVALPLVPPLIREELAGAEAYFRQRGRCIFCDVIASERREGERIVAESERWMALCPFASRFPYETWLLPKEHASHFEALDDLAADDLADFLRNVISRIESTVPGPSYNYMLHSSPFDSIRLDHYHWHIEIIPRLTKTAGFEWGTGLAINTVSPEQAARHLRHVQTGPRFAS